MEGGSVPDETSHSREQSRSLSEDREAVIQVCYDLLCSGQPLSEILAAAKRLSPATTAITIADGCGEICATDALCADESQSENIQSAFISHSLGPTQPKVP